MNLKYVVKYYSSNYGIHYLPAGMEFYNWHWLAVLMSTITCLFHWNLSAIISDEKIDIEKDL